MCNIVLIVVRFCVHITAAVLAQGERNVVVGKDIHYLICYLLIHTKWDTGAVFLVVDRRAVRADDVLYCGVLTQLFWHLGIGSARVDHKQAPARDKRADGAVVFLAHMRTVHQQRAVKIAG